ncbi:hypothetical protein MAPG_06187 [Magnaporthiopsis poae ATCC 64411]|uniref:Uncharacterized protein n=1 Tax=Magnaporthiopsis poae (strain ATCC 64411 / 73-15) TaxID=644358 RepID=A0A0C4E1D0_MAGP6|nr:hypothetical protein MAPG_06187 [Magnaporthiopsis poae ATCC 64411]
MRPVLSSRSLKLALVKSTASIKRRRVVDRGGWPASLQRNVGPGRRVRWYDDDASLGLAPDKIRRALVAASNVEREGMAGIAPAAIMSRMFLTLLKYILGRPRVLSSGRIPGNNERKAE